MGAYRTRPDYGEADGGNRAVTIILPIFFAAVIVGLFAKRVTVFHWAGLALLIALVIAYQLVKK